jgi:hypothetical protein
MKAGPCRLPWDLIGVLAALVLASGCAEPTTGTVNGEILVDGSAPKSGSIAFIPVDGKGTTAGAEIVDGKYTAEASLGSMKVEIRVPKVVGQKKLYDTPDSPMKSLMAESLPARYNDATELVLEVKPGENRQDYDLATR